MARIGKQRRSKCNMNEKMKSCNKGNNCTWVKKISMRKGYCRKGSVKKSSKYKQLPPKYFRQNYSINQPLVISNINPQKCGICFDDLYNNPLNNDVVRTMVSCGHSFHQDCIIPRLRLDPNCPGCYPISNHRNSVIGIPTYGYNY